MQNYIDIEWSALNLYAIIMNFEEYKFLQEHKYWVIEEITIVNLNIKGQRERTQAFI